MRIEEFLLNNGNKYQLRVVGEKEGALQIEIQTELFDGDGSTQEYLVKENILFPINTE